MSFIFPSFISAIFASFQAREKIDCYHCDERMRKDNALFVNFNGCVHPVCCHGCLAVLQTIERNGMTAQYLQVKASSPITEPLQ